MIKQVIQIQMIGHIYQKREAIADPGKVFFYPETPKGGKIIHVFCTLIYC